MEAQDNELAMIGSYSSLRAKRSNPGTLLKQPCVYIMASQKNGTIYTGITTDLLRRAWQHRNGQIPGFTQKYHCHLLVWFEQHENLKHAILREKQIKGGSRKKKLALIESGNCNWNDLYPLLK